jgi:hypothetical protein
LLQMLGLWRWRNSSVTAFFDEKLFATTSHADRRAAAKEAFMQIMVAKVYCAHLVSALGYNLLFKGGDVVWYRDPLPYLENSAEEWDRVFHYNRARTQRGAPFSPHTAGKLVNERKIQSIIRFHFSSHECRVPHASEKVSIMFRCRCCKPSSTKVINACRFSIISSIRTGLRATPCASGNTARLAPLIKEAAVSVLSLLMPPERAQCMGHQFLIADSTQR